jgi:hypothetical protein
MVSGFSGSGVVAETSAVEVDGLASFSHGQLHFMPFDPVKFATTSVVVVSLVEGLPGLAYIYVRRRVVQLRQETARRYFLCS